MTTAGIGSDPRSYRGLVAWQQAMNLADEVYRLTRTWPQEELYGMTSQARRASVSVASNIAEGQGRNSPGDFVRFLSIAYGSLCETETLLLLAIRIGLSDEKRIDPLLAASASVARLIKGLIRQLRARN